MNKEDFEKFLNMEYFFKEVYFYETSQSICHGYPLEEYYTEMIKLYSTDNNYFHLVLLNKNNEVFLNVLRLLI